MLQFRAAANGKDCVCVFFRHRKSLHRSQTKRVTDDFALSHWNIYFANPPNSVISEALHEIPGGRRVPMLQPQSCLRTPWEQVTKWNLLCMLLTFWHQWIGSRRPGRQATLTVLTSWMTNFRKTALPCTLKQPGLCRFEIEQNQCKQKCPRRQRRPQNWCQKSGQDIASKGMPSFQ